jgi:hypothetical protein
MKVKPIALVLVSILFLSMIGCNPDADDKVTVTGEFVLLDPLGVSPAMEDFLYLVPLEFQEGAPGVIPQFEVGKVPQAEVDEITFKFVFRNIEPGQYAVVMLSKDGAQLPTKKYRGEGYSIITISEEDRGKSIDIGILSL